MPMKFRCTSCTARLHVPRRWAGTTIECPKCTTRVVVPLEPPSESPVRFEDRSLEKKIEAIEAATIEAAQSAALQQAAADPESLRDSMRSAGMHRDRRMVAIPRSWLVMLVVGAAAAVVIAAAAGFWAGRQERSAISFPP